MPLPEGKVGKAIVNKYFPTDEWEEGFINTTADIKSISEYTGLDFNKIFNLSYSLFLLYRKEAWIYGLKQTEKGREFLSVLWDLKQVNADYKKIKSFQNKLKGGA